MILSFLPHAVVAPLVGARSLPGEWWAGRRTGFGSYVKVGRCSCRIFHEIMQSIRPVDMINYHLTLRA